MFVNMFSKKCHNDLLSITACMIANIVNWHYMWYNNLTKLQDLKHVTTLPDLSKLEKLRDIQIDNVPIDLNTLDESVRKLIHS